MVSLDLASQDNKQRIIDTFVNSIYVHDDRVIINFNCREESETIPLKLSTYVSDLRGSGEPAGHCSVLREAHNACTMSQ